MLTMGGITSTTIEKGNIEMHMPDFYFGHVPGTVRVAPWVKPAVIGGLVGIVLTVLIHVL